MINPMPLYEGRKQALVILNSMENKEALVNELMEIDPTKSKKYVEAFSKVLKQWMLSGHADDIQTMMLRLKHVIVPLIIEAEKKKSAIDVNSIENFAQLEGILTQASQKITRSSVKKGVQGLKAGVHYALVYENANVFGLLPFSWEASKILASTYVGNIEGQWCIAYQRDEGYWKKIVVGQGQAPVYIVGKKESSAIKYAFMYSEDQLEVWDSEDHPVINTNALRERLEISDEDNQTIWELAQRLAQEKIESFGMGEETVVRRLYSSFDISDNPVEGRVSIDVQTFHGDEDDNPDYDTDGYWSCEGDLSTGREFFTTDQGLALLKGVTEYFDDEDELNTIPNIIQNSLILEYTADSDTGTTTTFSDCLKAGENEDYDDSDEDISSYRISNLFEEKGYKSVLIITDNNDHSLSSEPFFEYLHRFDRKNYKGEMEIPYDFEGEVKQFSYGSINLESLGSFIENNPVWKQKLEGEWVRDDATEASYGQQFMNYENTKKKYNVKLYEGITPKKTKKAYKLFQKKKTRPGEIFPLFIGATVPTPIGEWIEAKFIPTKGFSERPGWHVGSLPIANHLKNKQGNYGDRVWAEVEIPADVDWQPIADKTPAKGIQHEVPKGGYYRFPRPKHQGGEWLIAGAIKVNRLLSNEEVEKLANDF